MKNLFFNRRAFLLFLVLSFGFKTSYAAAGASASDSLRVLCASYDKGSGLDGIVTLSAILDADSLNQPKYIIGDSVVNFFSDIKVSAIQKVHYITNKKLTKKFGKNLDNGVLIMELKPGEDFESCQVLPDVDNSTRRAFVTKFAIEDMDNTSGMFGTLAEGLVESYGTDDAMFRAYMEYSTSKASVILAVDSLNRKTFVKSFNDFRPGAIANITAYDAADAMKIIGDRGVNGLVIVLIDSRFTLSGALIPLPEKIRKRIRELEDVNLMTIGSRAPIIIK